MSNIMYKVNTGEYNVVVYSTSNGYFEHELHESLSGELLIENKKLVDYDGVYSLPREVRDILFNLGIDCEYVDQYYYKKVYISGKLEFKDKINNIAKSLKCDQIEIVSKWTYHIDNNHNISKLQAIDNLNDIRKCDIFVLSYDDFNDPNMFFELGYAYSKNKIIILFGDNVENSSIFAHLHSIRSCNDVDKLKEMICCS